MPSNWPPDLLLRPREPFLSTTHIFNQGDRIRSVDLIHSGVIKILTQREGQSVHLGVRTAGYLLACVSAIRGETHLFSAVAMTDCSITRIPLARFHNLRRSDLVFSASLQEMLASEIEDQFDNRAALGSGSGRARLEQLCVDLIKATGKEREDGSFKAHLTVGVTELARLLGTSREHVSRLLSTLEAENAITRDKGWLVLPLHSPLTKRVHNAS